MNSGIYQIRNKTNEKVYIGSTVHLRRRFNKHLRLLRIGKHHSQILQRSFDKHGESAFVFEIISHSPREYLLKMEQWFIDNLHPHYNVCRSTTNSRLGLKNSAKHNEALRMSNVGRPCKESTRQLISKSKIGRKLSLEAKEALRNQSSGCSVSQFDLNGNFINKYRSVKEAARQLRISGSGIRGCVQGKYKTSSGFIWKKLGEIPTASDIEQAAIDPLKKKSVIQMDMYGLELKKHESITKAGREVGSGTAGVWACCQGRNKQHKGYKWKYGN